MVSMRKSRPEQIQAGSSDPNILFAGTTARTAASLCGVNRKTAAFYFHRLREIVQLELEAENEAMFGGEIEVDESYFGGKRKGKQRSGCGGENPGIRPIEAGRQGLHEDHSRCLFCDPDADHRAQGGA